MPVLSLRIVCQVYVVVSVVEWEDDVHAMLAVFLTVRSGCHLDVPKYMVRSKRPAPVRADGKSYKFGSSGSRAGASVVLRLGGYA